MSKLRLLLYLVALFPAFSLIAADQPKTILEQAVGSEFMISTSHPLATETGEQVLRNGGTAVDAAIAAQMMLTLVEPQSSGIGGGAFMVYWSAKDKKLTTFDGRETAPLDADGSLFRINGDPNGKAMDWIHAAVGGRSVGTPGLLAMLELAHKKAGKIPWHSLFKPAIKRAKKGFRVSKRLQRYISYEEENLRKHPTTLRYYFDRKGNPLQAGTLLKNPALSQTLRRVALRGSSAFYSGKIAKEIVKTVRSTTNNPGLLSQKDFQNYQAKERPAICGNYRMYKICGMGPPTSGGLTVLQIVKILERFDLSSIPPQSIEAAHLFTQASRLAYADRNAHMADADFYPVPIKKLLNPQYLKNRSLLIKADQDMGLAKTGFPQEVGFDVSFPSTSHMSIVDSYGNIVSMTTTIEKSFGSNLMTMGFMLNNQLTDFSFVAKGKDGVKIANKVEPGKRPRSSMSPTIVFDQNNQPILVIGSPGGSRIISFTAKAIIAILDWGLNVCDAISLPHYINRNGVTELERNSDAILLKKPLEKKGHTVEIQTIFSGLNAIKITNDTYFGCSDPRGEGIASSN